VTQCAVTAEASFKAVMAKFATGVTVVTSHGADGPAGMTANAVASLSLDPLLIMVGFELRSRTLAAVRYSDRFAVNVLAAGQESLSRTFAGKQPEPEKFAGCAYADHAGVPLLTGTLAWLCCGVHAIHPGGDHVIVVGSVLDLGGSGGDPLLFYGGGYRRLAPPAGPAAPVPGPAGSVAGPAGQVADPAGSVRGSVGPSAGPAGSVAGAAGPVAESGAPVAGPAEGYR
jgi:flavin reductase (DIM6/NTAB) family NADH-FMN oxidoreductase RutF